MNFRQFKRKRKIEKLEKLSDLTGAVFEPLKALPEGTETKRVVLMEYAGFTAFIPEDSLYNGNYIREFIEQTGVVPPAGDLPTNIPEYFCPNAVEVLEVRP